MSLPTVWGLHGGSMGEADDLFLEKKRVGLGWSQAGDLKQAGSTRETFRNVVAAAFPHYKTGKVPVVAGMLYRFVHEMKVGDLVLYPRKADRTIHLGRISGDYEFRPDLSAVYPNVRAVEWTADRPRTDFLQSALYEIGSAMSLFQVREHAEHFLGVFEGKEKPSVVSAGSEDGLTAETEETTEDFIVRRLSTYLKGAPLERFVKDLLEAMGYRCRLTKISGDGGIDVEAARGPLGFEPPIVRAQVKSTTSNISDGDVKHLFASINPGEYGLFVTLGGFSKPAMEFAKTKANLSLVGGNDLVALVLEHYEHLSPPSKALIPLRRSYVPDVGSDSE